MYHGTLLQQLHYIQRHLSIAIVMFRYFYCYVCCVLCILFHCDVLWIVCVKMCTVLLPPGVNPGAVNEIPISYAGNRQGVVDVWSVFSWWLSFGFVCHVLDVCCDVWRECTSSIFSMAESGLNGWWSGWGRRGDGNASNELTGLSSRDGRCTGVSGELRSIWCKGQ
jgi:hypothetical protein